MFKFLAVLNHEQNTMFLTILIFLIAAYIFSGLVAWLAFVNLVTANNFSCWDNILVLLTSWIVIFIWSVWVILETRVDSEENIAPGLV